MSWWVVRGGGRVRSRVLSPLRQLRAVAPVPEVLAAAAGSGRNRCAGSGLGKVAGYVGYGGHWPVYMRHGPAVAVRREAAAVWVRVRRARDGGTLFLIVVEFRAQRRLKGRVAGGDVV